VGSFLQAAAKAVPPGLSAEITEILQKLADEVQ
jgi:hypothetical protein